PGSTVMLVVAGPTTGPTVGFATCTSGLAGGLIAGTSIFTGSRGVGSVGFSSGFVASRGSVSATPPTVMTPSSSFGGFGFSSSVGIPSGPWTCVAATGATVVEAFAFGGLLPFEGCTVATALDRGGRLPVNAGCGLGPEPACFGSGFADSRPPDWRG